MNVAMNITITKTLDGGIAKTLQFAGQSDATPESLHDALRALFAGIARQLPDAPGKPASPASAPTTAAPAPSAAPATPQAPLNA